MSPYVSHPAADASDRHRRGSSPAVKEPSEPRDEQGRSLPPHMQTGSTDVPVPRAPRRPRSKRQLTTDEAKKTLERVALFSCTGDPAPGQSGGVFE